MKMAYNETVITPMQNCSANAYPMIIDRFSHSGSSKANPIQTMPSATVAAPATRRAENRSANTPPSSEPPKAKK